MGRLGTVDAGLGVTEVEGHDPAAEVTGLPDRGAHLVHGEAGHRHVDVEDLRLYLMLEMQEALEGDDG